MSQYSGLAAFSQAQQQAVKLLMDRLAALEARVADIGAVSQALTTHLDSGGNQLKSVADPTAATDAVTQQYMQKWVEGRVAPLEARVTALEP